MRPPLPLAPGRPARHDPEDVRGGAVTLFPVTEPLHGWRAVSVSEQRTRLDVAACITDLVDIHSPDAARIVLVMDQFTTHTPASRYAAFPPVEAKRLRDRLEIHDTPKHGSWRTMAEIELGVLARQGLRQRPADRKAMEQAVAAWAERRNRTSQRIDWQFTAPDARITLRRLSPAYED